MMRLYKKNRPELFFALFAVLYVFVSAALFEVPLGKASVWGLVQILLYVTGHMLYHLVYKKPKAEPWLSEFFLSYAFGYALVLPVYLLCKAVFRGLGWEGWLCVAILSLFSLISRLFVKERKWKSEQPVGNHWEIWTLLGVYFLLVLFGYCGYHFISRGCTDGISIHPDALYWIENASSIVRGVRPYDARMAGATLDYHYFASAFLAFEGELTGIDLYSLGYSMYGFSKTILVFGACSVLFDRLLDGRDGIRKRLYKLLGIAIVLFSSGFESQSIVTYTDHMLLLPFGCDISLAFGCLVIALSREAMRSRFSLPHCLCTALLFVLCAGHKAPIALVLLVFTFVLCCGWLKNREYQKLLYGAGEALGFFLVMVFCINLFSGNESRVNAGEMSLLASATPIFGKLHIQSVQDLASVSGILRYLLATALHWISIHPVVIFLSGLGLAGVILKKHVNLFFTALIAGMLFGFFMGYFNRQDGNSQMYYSFAGIMMAAPVAVVAADRIPLRVYQVNGFWILVALCVLGQGYLFMNDSYGNGGALRSSIAGYKNVMGMCRPQTGDFRLTDLQAMDWIRENTEKDAVFLADRAVITEDDRFMYYGTFSERQMYLEGDGYFYDSYVDERARRKNLIHGVYSEESNAFDRIRDEGVSYIIQTKELTKAFVPLDCQLVFENETIRVWKMLLNEDC